MGNYDKTPKPDAKARLCMDVFSEDELKKIHEATLDVFENVGILVDSEEAKNIYVRAGAVSEERADGNFLVKIPPYVVNQAIEDAPKWFKVYGRTEDRDFDTANNNVGFVTFGECVKIIDPITKEVRATTKKDLGEVTKLADYFETIVAIERQCCSGDYPAEIQPLHNFQAMVNNTSKPIFIGAVKGRNVKPMYEMACAAVGGKEEFDKRPYLYIFVCPVSPLHMAGDCCEQVIESAKLGLGIAIIPMALSAATSVATLAGTIVSHNVEVLSAVILAQLVKKGTPCVYSTMTTIMDLKYMISACGAPEHGLMSAGIAQLCRYYGFPSWTGAGISDSKLPDAQSGYEYAINASAAAYANATFVMGAGALESCMTVDYAKIVMDCEAQTFIRRILQGIEVNDDTLALDVLRKNGPASQFLGVKHTRQHMKEQVQSNVFSRDVITNWEKKGAKDTAEVAYEKAEAILEKYQAAPLAEGANEKMDKIIEAFSKEIGLS